MKVLLSILAAGAYFAVLLTPTLEPAPVLSSPRDVAMDSRVAPADSTAPASASAPLGRVGTCGDCHTGIEVMHPWHPLGCVDCHGGNDSAKTKQQAHVGSRAQLPNDERVLSTAYDKALLRFLNPSDLRVVDQTCGTCHAEVVKRVEKSLHATTAGHLCDGLYENGVIAKRSSPFGIFAITDDEVRSEHGVKALRAFPAFGPGDRDDLGTHFQDLGRKSCMRCHLWSNGSAVRGRLGQDGDYRGSGCATCHVVYAPDGLSRSADPTVDRFTPGHPKVHAMTTAPPTDTCVSCHVGDASVGMHFRGIAQLVPGMPAGPDVPNTTSTPRNGAFYIQDPVLTPPDVHHQRGMHCVDCHTGRDVMGDGELHEAMEHAVEIECTDCHGGFEEHSNLTTSRGTPLKHLRRERGAIILTSRVTGAEHVVPQVADIVNPAHPRYNAVAAKAMNSFHRRLECYACHTSWNVNFFGFHFDRNEGFTQLDLISGTRTEGRVTTQEKVFASLKEFRLGWNSEGAIAPYLVGFSSMGSVHTSDGNLALRQELPETAAGLSGMTMIHHQVHSVQPAARSCVECHRSSTTWGTGSPNYRLARELVFAVGRGGLNIIAYDARNPMLGLPLASVAIPGASRALARIDVVHGRAQTVFVAVEARRDSAGERIANGMLVVVDVRDPMNPSVRSTIETYDPRALSFCGDLLLVADGDGGLKIFREKDGALHATGEVVTVDARDLAVHGHSIFIADGAGGLVIVDVADEARPFVRSALHLGAKDEVPDDARGVAVMWQGSRPRPADRTRTEPRLLVAVADGVAGLILVNATEPTRPVVLRPAAAPARSERTRGTLDVVLGSHWDLGDAQGQIPTEENDYAYLLTSDNDLEIFRITDPQRMRRVGRADLPGADHRELSTLHIYNPPFLNDYIVSAGEAGLVFVDVAKSSDPVVKGALEYTEGARGAAFEEFPLDRMIDEQGTPLKDISHPGARYLSRAEMERVLAVPAAVLGTDREEVGYRVRALPEAKFGAMARTMLSKLDKNKNGIVDGDELLKNSAAKQRDADHNGVVSLHELIYGAQRRESVASDAMRTDGGMGLDARALALRTAWLELLATQDAASFDLDGDGFLENQTELRSLIERALDVHNDSKLDEAESAALPGGFAPPRLGARQRGDVITALDRNKDGKLSSRELDPALAGALVLDLDGDKKISLSEVGGSLRDSGATPRPMLVDARVLLRKFDRNGDQGLDRREIPAHLYALLSEAADEDKNGRLDERELLPLIARSRDAGLRGIPRTGFARFDLDGDGRIDALEFPGPSWVFRRLDDDRDGYLGTKARR